MCAANLLKGNCEMITVNDLIRLLEKCDPSASVVFTDIGWPIYYIESARPATIKDKYGDLGVFVITPGEEIQDE